MEKPVPRAQSSVIENPAAEPIVAPSWITPELLGETARTWQPFYGRPLTDAESVEILVAVGQLFDLLELGNEQAIRCIGKGVEP